jgi:hypothetical protein
MPREAEAEQCARCGQVLGPRTAYQFPTPSGFVRKCLACAVGHPPMLRRSAVIAAIVGTVLTAINQGDLLLAGRWLPALAWKLPLTYAVPFIVATLGALGAGKVPGRP